MPPAIVAKTNQISCFRSKTVGSACIDCEALKRMTSPRKVSPTTIRIMKSPIGGIRQDELGVAVRALIMGSKVSQLFLSETQQITLRQGE